MDPLILYRNVFENNESLVATDTATGFDVNNVIDLRTYTLWKANSAGTKYLTVRTKNDLTNGDFDTWSGGGSAAPDNWTLNGGGSVAQEGTIKKVGAFSCKLTSDADGNVLIQVLDVTAYRGKTVVFSVWAYTAVASAARISIQDNLGSNLSDFHTGGGGWEYLSVTYAVPTDATFLWINLSNENTGGTDIIYFDLADYAETKYKTADAYSVFNHNFLTADATVSLEYSSDNFDTVTTEVSAGFVFSSNKAYLKTFTEVTANYWRLKIVTTSIAVYVGVLAVGSRMDIPYALQSPFNAVAESPQIETANSKGGNLLGSIVNFTKITIDPTILWPTWAFMRDTFKPFWDDHGSQGKPFFYSWDNVNYPEDVRFVKFTRGMQYRAPFTENSKHPSFTLNMEGIKE